jgi:outer membrane protein, heavy metal efflux system
MYPFLKWSAWAFVSAILAVSHVSAETLQSLAAEAVRNSPALMSADATIHAESERIAPARTWPDPMIGIAMTNVSATDITLGDQAMSQVMFRATQRLPIAGKLESAEGVTRAGVETARVRREIAANALAARVMRTALNLYRLDRLLVIDRGIERRFAAMISAGEGRVAVGTGRQTDLLRLVLSRETAAAGIEETAIRRGTIAARMNGLLSRSRTAPVGSLAVEPLRPVTFDTTALIEQAMVSSPTLRLRRTMQAKAVAMKRLAHARRIPDPVISAQYGYRADLPGVYNVGVAVALPIHAGSRQQAAIREATARIESAESAIRATEIQVRADITATIHTIHANAALIRSYRTKLLPRARQTADATLASFSTGGISLIRVLDAMITLQKLERALVTVETRQRAAFVTLAELLGIARSGPYRT